MKKLQHEENMESERTMETRNKCNAEKVRPEESIETEQNFEKSAKEECTIVHKRITGRYTLVPVIILCFNKTIYKCSFLSRPLHGTVLDSALNSRNSFL